MSYDLARLTNVVLMRELAALVALHRRTTALLLAHLAEVDERRLYLPAGFPTMRDFCVKKLRFSEESAYKRIQVARAGRRHPSLFTALADGRIHFTAALLLAPHLKPDNYQALIADATHCTRLEVERLIAGRFPQPEALRLDEGIAALGRVPSATPEGTVCNSLELIPVKVPDSSPAASKRPAEASSFRPGPIAPSVPTRVAPIAPQRFTLQVTISQATHDKLREVQDLLAHAVPSRDVATVLDRALEALREHLLKRKASATAQPRPTPRPTRTTRHIPAEVRRQVWERDQGQCTFVAEDGTRCEARRLLEFDHILPVARGGKSTAENLRLRCRPHNQFAAERAFGKAFMERKRNA